MENLQAGPLLGFIHGLATKSSEDLASDRELLQRFASRRDEAAFAALVHRHGSMVLRVAQRTLHQRQDAEDVFQATFLVLARKAEHLAWRDSITNWLYEVTYRLACEARAATCRQQLPEKKWLVNPAPDPFAEVSLREALVALDEELIRLPSRFRLPMVLCCLEGATQEEAARKLGWSLATFKRRLIRGRELLHARLAGRGLTLAAALAALEFSRGAGSAAAPTVLVGSTVQAALAHAAGQSLVNANSVRAALLARKLVAGLMLTKLKLAGALAVVCVCAAGLGIVWSQSGTVKLPVTEEPGEFRAAQANIQAPSPPNRTNEALPDGAFARLGTLQLRQAGCIFQFAADGRTFFTLDTNRTLRIRDTATGQILQEHRLPTANESLEFLAAFTRDGRRLVVRSVAGFNVWDLANVQRVRSLHMEALSAFRVALSPDDRTFAVLEYSGGNGSLRLWDLESGGSRVVGEHRGMISGVAFAPDGKRVVTIDSVGSHGWEVATGQSIWHNKDRIDDRPLFLPDGKSFLAKAIFPKVALRRWDAASGKPLVEEKLPNLEPNSGLLISPDGSTLAIVSLDKGLRFWNLKTGVEGPRVREATVCFGFAPDGQTVVGGAGTALGRWEVATGRALYPDTENLGHQGSVNALAFTPDGRQLVSASMDDQTIRFWDIATRKTTLKIKGAKNWGDVIALTPDTKQIADTFNGIDDSGLVRIWDVATGRETKRLSARNPQTNGERLILSALKSSPDGKTVLAIGGIDDSVRGMTQAIVAGWDLPSGRLLFRRDTSRREAAKCISPDAKLLLGCDGRLVELESGRQILDLKTTFDPNWDICVFSPDQLLLAGTQSESFQEGGRGGIRMKAIQIWEVASGKLVAKFETIGMFRHLVFTPDGQLLIASDSDAIRVWEVATSREIAVHTNSGNVHDRENGMSYASSLAISPDGQTLASGHADTTILLWDLRPQRRNSGKALTATELQDAWSLLANVDAKRAYAAMGDLAATPAQTAKLLQERLEPAKDVPIEKIRQLILDLDAAAFPSRESAQKQLGSYAELAEPALREALKQSPTAEQRRRLEQILSTPFPQITPEALRSVRAIRVLERIATPEARRLLQKIAAGAPEAKLTRQAKGSLDRMNKVQRN